jgi:hypothetical protein
MVSKVQLWSIMAVTLKDVKLSTNVSASIHGILRDLSGKASSPHRSTWTKIMRDVFAPHGNYCMTFLSSELVIGGWPPHWASSVA